MFTDLLLTSVNLLRAELLESVLHGHLEVVEVVFFLNDFTVLVVQGTLELLAQLLPHVLLHEIVVIFEGSELSIGDVKLVDHVVTLGAHLGINYHINVLEELLTLRSIVNDLHLFQI